MKVRKLSLTDAKFERSPGQEADIFTADLIGAGDGGPVTVGYGRWGEGESLTETMAVHATMIVLEGRLTVWSDAGEVELSPGDIAYMPEGQTVTIRAHEGGATTAYVTYPHWAEAK